MENYVEQQLLELAVSLLLGISASLLYDILRPFRIKKRRWRWLTHVLDTVFALMCMVLFFRLATSLGRGQLRLYMLLGGALGAIFWQAVPSPVWREVWDFWLASAAAPVRRLVPPARRLWKKAKKSAAFLQKKLSFSEEMEYNSKQE